MEKHTTQVAKTNVCQSVPLHDIFSSDTGEKVLENREQTTQNSTFWNTWPCTWVPAPALGSWTGMDLNVWSTEANHRFNHTILFYSFFQKLLQVVTLPKQSPIGWGSLKSRLAGIFPGVPASPTTHTEPIPSHGHLHRPPPGSRDLAPGSLLALKCHLLYCLSFNFNFRN